MTAAQPELVRCSSCHRDYALAPLSTQCPACGGASWVVARIAGRDSADLRAPAART
jgi:DNA polymerase II large subunit